MQTFLVSAYRIASWLAAGSLGLLGAIILCDGLTSSLAAHYRAVTLIVSLFSIMAGLGFFALERNLSRVRQHQDAIHDRSGMPRESIKPWRMIHAILTLAAGGTFLLTMAGILGAVGRLKSGVGIFG
jgi:hypothetical protein